MKTKIFIAGIINLLCASHTLYPLIATRSQSLDLARFMAGWTNQVHLNEKKYGTFSFIPQYNHSLQADAIANCLFGKDCLNICKDTISINVSGSQVQSRKANDWLADYFGLPTDFQSTVFIKPETKSYIYDIHFFVGFDHGLFFWVHAPIVHCRSAMNLTEKIINSGVNNYAPGYFAPIEVQRSNLQTNFQRFIGLEKVPTIDTADGIVFAPLNRSKISVPCNQTLNTTKLSDVYFIGGWNFLLEDDYHVGLGATVVAPTGSHVTDEFIFQPIVGNGHHWELGGYFTSRYAFWHGCDDYNSLTFSCEAIITHMFSTDQQRTLDIKNGCSSRYMLTEYLNVPVSSFLFGNGSNNAGGPTAESSQPNEQFKNVYIPLANLTSTSLQVSHAVQADIAVMLTYTTHHQSLSFDFGYDFWAKSKDKIKIKCPTALSSGHWALKGDAYTYGFGATNAIDGANENIALSATESLATIHAGTNTPIGTDFNASQMQNPGIDNPQFGVTSTISANTTDYINFAPGLIASNENQQRTSIDPIVLSENDLDLKKEVKHALTNKFFIHGSYTWPDLHCHWAPYLGFGGFVEIASSNDVTKKFCSKNSSKNVASCSKECGLSQAGVWIKSGLSF